MTKLTLRSRSSLIQFCVDMINMMKIGYEPAQCEWIYSRGAVIAALAW